MQTDSLSQAFFLIALALALALPASFATAEDSPPVIKDAPPAAAAPTTEKAVSGMSIVGNDEAPKALVIVPWKTSDLGETLDVSKLIDDGRTPVDREVFRRALDYYEIRTGNDH